MEEISIRTRIKSFIKQKITKLNPFNYCAFVFTRNKHPSSFRHYLSIVAIVKNEAPYIQEWIEYHLLVGIEKFYIYDNGSEDNLQQLLKPYIDDDIVKYIYYPGEKKQIWAYNDVLKYAQKETFWLAVIDLDEFIVPISTRTITEFLYDFEDIVAVEINWVCYGSSGQEKKTEGLVIERFKDHSLLDFDGNRNVKTIMNPRTVSYISVHDAVYYSGKRSVNIHKEENIIYFHNREAIHDKMRINHYFCKSYEEYLLKRNRGIATARKNEKRPLQDFYNHNKNDVKNDTIMDKYIPAIKEILDKRNIE
ncbi:hypothetical protein AGMMS49928_00170 [Spirochaetia bacterium]|nr:hypothetical protein AGMMS49928_00170 [Spirochaetia bacterium]